MAKIIAPVVTIFNEEEKPDYAGNKKVIDFLIEGGLDGILVLGSAGEFPDLNEQERLDFFRFYAEYVNGRVELLAGRLGLDAGVLAAPASHLPARLKSCAREPLALIKSLVFDH